MSDPTDPKNQNTTSDVTANSASGSDLPTFMDPSVQASSSPSPAPEDTQPDEKRPSFLTIEDPNKQAVPSPTPAPNTTSASTPPPINNAPVSLNSSQKPTGGSTKKIAAILGILGLIAATVIGVIAVGSNRLKESSAWDCNKYTFNMTSDGVVSVSNGSSRNEPLQKADVKINDSKVATFDVPALTAGENSTLGTVTVPTGSFTWEVIGTRDCKNGGSYSVQSSPSPQPSASPNLNQISCSAVSAYDTNWQQLSPSQLSELKPGEVVRFTVSGTASNGNFDQARFTINGTQRAVVTDTRPGTDEFFDEYTIPNGVTTINVEAQVHHTQTDTWY